MANAEIQSGGYFGCFDCSDAFDRVFFYRVVVVFKIALLMADKDWAFLALCDHGSLWLYHGSRSRIQNIPQTTDL